MVILLMMMMMTFHNFTGYGFIFAFKQPDVTYVTSSFFGDANEIHVVNRMQCNMFVYINFVTIDVNGDDTMTRPQTSEYSRVMCYAHRFFLYRLNFFEIAGDSLTY